MSIKSTLDILTDDIDKMNNTRNTITIIPSKKKKKFMILDGIIKLNVTVTPNIKCPCGMPYQYGYCKHILKILLNHYKLTNISIWSLRYDDIYCYFKYLLKEKNYDINLQLINKIHKKFDKQECGICCDILTYDKYKLNLHECKHCYGLTHNHCINVWFHKNNPKKHIIKNNLKFDHSCIYCRQ